MPEDRSPPQETGRELRSPSKHKWRGKLFSTEGRFGRNAGDLESADDDVANFLQTAAPNGKKRPQPAHLAPRIDTAAAPRFPAATDISEPAKIVDVYRRPKSRQNKGLHVTFHTAAPEIIGVGGDEAELPSKDVSKSLQHAAQAGDLWARDLPTRTNDGSGRDRRGSSPIPPDDPTFQPKPLQRAPTGLSEIFDEKALDHRDQDFDTSSMSTSVSPPKRKPLPLPPYQIPNQQNHNKSSGPEDADPDVSPLTDDEYGSDGDHAGHSGGPPGYSMSSYLGIPSADTLAGNSITPRPSPQASYEHRDAQPPSYGFPTMAPEEHTAKTHVDSGALSGSKAKAFSLRQVAKGLGDDSLDEFDARVRRFNDIFRLGVSTHTDLMGVSFVQWIRSACWWFLKGRQGVEGEVRSNADKLPHTGPSSTLKQAYVNLAKAWWIVKEITPNHPEIARYGKASMNSLCAMIKSFGDQTLAKQAEVHVHLVANMRALTMSMKRNEKLPPPDLELQRLDLHVLLELPRLPSDFARLMVNNSFERLDGNTPDTAEPFFPIPIGDTERHFNFGRMFVEVSSSSDSPGPDLRIPCILSMLRDRNEWGVQATIASQDGQVNLVIADETSGVLTWRSVKWQIQSHEMLLTIPDSSKVRIKIQIKFAEKDFKTLWGICDYTQRTKKNFATRKDEELIFERTLRSFQCDDAAHFPAESIADCRLRVFERKSTTSEQSAQRTTHNGYRCTVITPPRIKSLSVVNYDLGRENPVLFRIHRGDKGSRLILRILPASIRISLCFAETQDIDTFRHLLSGTSATKEDHYFLSLRLENLIVTENQTSEDPLSWKDSSRAVKLPWNKLRILRTRPPSRGHEHSPTESENFRLLADSNFGTLTDRIHFSPGELQLGLSTDNFNEMKLLRQPQSGMTWSLADERVSKEEISSICMSLKNMLTSTTRRTYHFCSLEDLHSFETAVTGFSVLFDGHASNFAISRRRTVVPVHKKWEANTTRLQVLKHDKTVQLVAFFKDFSHGTCINFVLKITDVFEVFSKASLLFLRIVDAKFALPKGSNDESRDFVCLDMPEYPSEHDDITIGFDNENGTLRDIVVSYQAIH